MLLRNKEDDSVMTIPCVPPKRKIMGGKQVICPLNVNDLQCVARVMSDRRFLEELKEYIEKAEENIQQNYGKYQTPEEIREAGLMPHIYDEVLERLSE